MQRILYQKSNIKFIASNAIYSGRCSQARSSWKGIIFKLAILFLISLPFSLQAQTTYSWNGSISNDYAIAGNWTPSRTTVTATDILAFDNGGTYTVTNVPTAETIGALVVSNNTNVSLSRLYSSTGATISTLTIGGITGTDLDIQSGSALTLAGSYTSSSVNTRIALTFSTSTTAEIAGAFTIDVADPNYTYNNSFNASNCDVTVKSGGTLNNNGNIAGYKSAVFEAGATYDLKRNGGGFPSNSSWDPASTIILSGVKSSLPTVFPSGSSIGNLTINCPSQTTSATWGVTTLTIKGNLNIIATGTATLLLGGSTNITINGDFIQTGGAVTMGTIPTITIDGNFSQSAGSLNWGTSYSNVNFKGNFSQSGGTITIPGTSASAHSFKGNLIQTAGTINKSSTGVVTFTFNGTSSQSVNLAGTVSGKVGYTLNNTGGLVLNSQLPVNTGATLTITNAGTPLSGSGTVVYTGTTALVYNGSSGAQSATAAEFPTTGGPTDLTINNSNGVDLPGDRTLSGTLTLTSGILNLNNNNLTVGAISVTSPSATKMVVPGTGQLLKTFATGSSSFTYPIGEIAGTTEYLPVMLSFSANSTSRTIGVSMTKGKHASMDVGGVQTDYLNRYWKFSDSEVSGGTYSYTAGFTYLSADVNGTETNIKVNRWDGTIWSQITSSVSSNQLNTTLAQSETNAPLHNNEFTGRVASSNSYTWNGSVSSDWQTAANWTPSGIPTATDDVTISNASASNQPEVPSGVGVSAKTLTLSAGSLTLAANASLTVEGNFTFAAPASTNFDCSSTFNYANAGSQTIYALAYGNLVSSNTGARTLANGVISICESFTPGTNTYTTTGNTIEFNGTAAQNIPAFAYNNLVSSSTGSRTISGTIQIAGTFTPGTNTYTTTNSTIDFNGTAAQTIPAFTYHTLTSSGNGARTLQNSGTIKINGTFSPGTGNYNTFGSTVEFGGSTFVTIPLLTNANYNNLIVSGTSTYSFGASMTIEGDFTQSNGTVNVSNGAVNNTINFAGDVNLTGGTFRLISASTATGATVNIGTTLAPKNLNISGNGNINLESTSSNNGVAVLEVTGNVTTNSSFSNVLDLGNGIITDNEVRIAGNLTISGTGGIYMTSTSRIPKGIVFNGSGVQTLTSSVTHKRVPMTVNAGSSVQLGANYSVAGVIVSSTRTIISTAGTLDLAGFMMSSDNTNNAAFTVDAGGTVTTSNGTIKDFAVASITLGGSLDLGTGQIDDAGPVSGNAGIYINGTLKTAKAEGLSGSTNTALVSGGVLSFGAGSTIEYNGTGAQTITARSDYQNLTISGNRGGAAITLGPGTIGVAGTFEPSATSTTWTTTGNTIEFKGTTQTLPVFSYNNLTISGSGTKNLAGNITVPGTLTMNGGELQTGSGKVILSSTANLVESSTSYITGNVEASADLSAPGTYTFNGSGLSLSPQAGSSTFPGLTTIRRVTGSPISANGNQGIGRFYEISAANSSNLDVTMVFGYHDHELGTINEANLVFFKSATGSGPWSPQGQTSRDAAANTVTLTGVTGFSVWTLGDENNPLPVELVSFDAKKVGTNAELTWTTASEYNSEGFEVQVSADGREFRKLGFVESRNGNSMQQYGFTDAENGKYGMRYYRLKQIDFDGKVTYFASKVVRFEAEKLQLAVYPNPSNGMFNLELPEGMTFEVTVTDLTGKVVKQVSAIGRNMVLNISGFSKGIYLLNVVGNDKTATRKLVIE